VSLSADGTTVIIGAEYNSGHASYAGHARVFRYDATLGWQQLGDDIDGKHHGDYAVGARCCVVCCGCVAAQACVAEPQQGLAVGISDDGNVVVVSSPYNDAAGRDAGHVRVFSFDGSAWLQIGSDIEGEMPDNWAVSIHLCCL
jgi:hypothetical protein